MPLSRRITIFMIATLAFFVLGCSISGDEAAAPEFALLSPDDTSAEIERTDPDSALANDPTSDAPTDLAVLDGGKTKVAVILTAPTGESGWSFANNEARIAAQAATGIETDFTEVVSGDRAAFETAVQQFIDDGFTVIMTTSFDQAGATEQLAADNPTIVFEHISGSTANDTNFGSSFGRMYQARYLAGMAAGVATESDRIGYVAAFPIPEVVRGINAFSLGAARTNPNSVVEVAWTNTWFDPSAEGSAAQELIDAGADVLTMHQESTATGLAITDAGGTFIGYHSDMSEPVGAYLTAPIWDWTPRYVAIIESAQDGSYTPQAWWGGMADGVVDIVIPDTSPAALPMRSTKQLIIDGKFDIFDSGLIIDQAGTAVIKDGIIQVEILDPVDPSVVVAAPGDEIHDGVLLNMNFFVTNVVGSVDG